MLAKKYIVLVYSLKCSELGSHMSPIRTWGAPRGTTWGEAGEGVATSVFRALDVQHEYHSNKSNVCII